MFGKVLNSIKNLWYSMTFKFNYIGVKANTTVHSYGRAWI